MDIAAFLPGLETKVGRVNMTGAISGAFSVDDLHACVVVFINGCR